MMCNDFYYYTIYSQNSPIWFLHNAHTPAVAEPQSVAILIPLNQGELDLWVGQSGSVSSSFNLLREVDMSVVDKLAQYIE